MFRRVAHSQKNRKWVHYWLRTWTIEQLGLNIRQSWWHFLGSEIHFTAVQKECATPPHFHPTSRYFTAHDQFYQAFHCKQQMLGLRRHVYKASVKLCSRFRLTCNPCCLYDLPCLWYQSHAKTYQALPLFCTASDGKMGACAKPALIVCQLTSFSYQTSCRPLRRNNPFLDDYTHDQKNIVT